MACRLTGYDLSTGLVPLSRLAWPLTQNSRERHC